MAKKFSGPMTTTQAAELLIQTAQYRHNLSTLFRDFVSMAAIALQNGFEPRDEAWEKREAEYLEIVRRYDRDVIDAICQCLGSLMLIAQKGHSDHMGELYMALGTGVKGLGQFFTPYHISRLMASMIFDRTAIDTAIDTAIAKQGYFSVNEPTCGAGGMVVAIADVMRELGYDPEMQLRVVAQDLDRHCCRMTYINCVLHRIPATIIQGNTLLMEEKEVTHTPALYIQHGYLRQKAA